MRRTALTCLGFASFAFAPVLFGSTQIGCQNGAPGENVIRAAEPIQGGTVDTGDPAVVGILICQGSQVSSLCSGSLIGPNLVLTAHHCVANPNSTSCGSNSFGSTSPASDFYVTTSYNAAATLFNGSGQCPSADGSTWWGVKSVTTPGNDICGQDLAALTLSSSISGVCPLIPSVDTDVTPGETYTAIGFGVTSPQGQTAGTRYKVTGMTVNCAEQCNDPTMSSTEEWLGMNSAQKGTCEGDSGGPAIDSSGRVIGSVSRGPSNACNQTVYESYYGEGAWIKQIAQAAATAGGYAAAGWVTGGSTSNAANGYCGTSSSSSSSSSTSSTSSTSSSSSSSSSSSGGSMPSTCGQADGYQGCCDGNTLYYCAKSASSSSAPSTLACASGTVCGWNASKGYYDCVQPPGGADPSNTYPQACGGTTSSSSSSSSASSTSSSTGGMTCGFTTNDPTCDGCLTTSCCNEEQACANDSTCTTCVTSASPPSSCAQNTAYVNFANCFSNNCNTQCGGSSSSSSSSGGTTSSTTGSGSSSGQTTGSTGNTTSSSGNTTSSGGVGGASTTGSTTSSSGTTFGNGGSATTGNGVGGATGVTGTGTGVTTGGLGNQPGASSGCDVAPTGGNAPASPTSLAGLLLGAALAFSRKRR